MTEMCLRKRQAKTNCTVLEIWPLSIQVCPRAEVGNLRPASRTRLAKQNHRSSFTNPRSSFTNCQYLDDPPSGGTFYDSPLPATSYITCL